MSKGSAEKSEKPTPGKREKARKKGQVAKSREVSSAVILIASMGLFYIAGSWMVWNLADFMGGIFMNMNDLRMQDNAGASALLIEIFKTILFILIPFMSVIVIAGIISNLAQIGFLFSTEMLTPKLSHLNPISGMKKFVSIKSLVELVKSLLKITIVGGIGYWVLKGELENISGLIQMQVSEILAYAGTAAFKISLYVCIALIILAILDITYQRWQYEQDLKMTKQEVKDELKQQEGDPKVKAKIKQKQREMAMRRMMEKIPDADVVITNPIHLAIALEFNANEMVAPMVSAKGANAVAERIKEIARENKVPIVENKVLARTIYKLVEIDDFIPADLYRAVAEVLAYVYRLKGIVAGAQAG